jgi:uncharacterized protein (TIGR02452 family)
MSLAGVAQETLKIVETGSYRTPSGVEVSVGSAVARAVAGTRLYRPDDYARLADLKQTQFPPEGEISTHRDQSEKGLVGPRIEVTAETTAQAARRLIEQEREAHVLALNFASARNPGGGFLRGAKAQEEDLARCSALYPCQLTQREYYDRNRACESLIYTDHLIYSPDVPFFRDDRLGLLPAPFLVSIVTSPAPNAGEELRRRADAGPHIRAALERRAEQILRVALHHQHRVLVLGAWGCGVFRNDPRAVSDVFSRHLENAPFRDGFHRVVFAIYDRTRDQDTLRAFRERFASFDPGLSS